jgi:two-component system, OmpR family, sensor histidine kinase KdpD
MGDTKQKPEEILARIQAEEIQKRRGKLKIFLGAAAGVGKTYTMLEAAQKHRQEGLNVLAGVVVTHGRKQTEELLEGLPIIDLHSIEYKGAILKEFDIDEALKRKPNLILVDELAHTNAPGARHDKRWQDVEELREAGINVFTTLNIQHLESVNDLIAQVTGVKVRETVPDSVFDNATEVELVDLPPDELIQRLRDGKIYIPENARDALENFFRKGNLIALRELALRVTAERVDAEMIKYRKDVAVDDVWPVADRIIVCVGPGPLSARVVRATKRMATRLRAEWMAVYVETPGSARFPERDRNRIIRTLQLAERLGAETTRITGNTVSEELVAYARKQNASKIVIGKPARPRWREVLFGSVVDDLIRRSGNIDVYVITGDKQEGQERKEQEEDRTKPGIRNYWYAAAIVAAATGLDGSMFHHLATVNLAMVYQLAIVMIAVRFGKGPSVLASLLSVAAFDFFFVPPYYSFAVSDTEYILTFLVMLSIGLLLSTLTSTVKLQAELSRKREHQTAALYDMTSKQAKALTVQEVVDISQKQIGDLFGGKVVIFLANEDRKLLVVSQESEGFSIDTKEQGVAQWVFLNGQPAGANTATLSGAKALYLPLNGSKSAIGVIALQKKDQARFNDLDEMHLFETFVNHLALVIERAQLSAQQSIEREESMTS